MIGTEVAPASMSEVAPLLELDNVAKVFGALRATDGVSTKVMEGEHRALIGPNGAGKSTLFKLITGQLLPTEGKIRFSGQDITNSPAHERARLGLAMTFQHSNLLDELTVRENITIAVQRKMGVSTRWHVPIRNQSAVHERTDQLLEELSLQHRASKEAGSLAYGERRRVEIAVAYATDPRLLLLDEPAAGMSPGEIEDFLGVLLDMPQLTFIMIEHNIDVVMRIASSITVLDYGRVIAEGAPAEVTASAEVQKAYLGSALGQDLFQ
jgi:branched-chain amino acid transport system ATP-binding protein